MMSEPKPSLFNNPEFWGGIVVIGAGVVGGLYLILRAMYTAPKIITVSPVKAQQQPVQWRNVDAVRGQSPSPAERVESGSPPQVAEQRKDDTPVVGVNQEPVPSGGQSPRDRYRSARFRVDGQDDKDS